MGYFSLKEVKFIESNEVCRLASSDLKNIPHVVPVNYIFKESSFYIFSDYETKKIKNIRMNPNVALIIDVYHAPKNRAILIIGKANIIERGDEYREIYNMFYKKFGWVRADPWKEGEAPLIKIVPNKKISWGI
jgi:nitroimidazol reductase NimA-like FMN-containing flavoprotein (pyridoxamine 5'-phosphate oxidase superfamily)